MTLFIRVLEPPVEEKAESLLHVVASLRDAVVSTDVCKRVRYEIEPHVFSEVPGSPFAYWLSDRLRSLFQSLPSFEAPESDRRATKGLATTDDPQFLRTWWEIAASRYGIDWLTFAKGGAVSAYYFDINTCILWRGEGHRLKAYLDHKIGAPGQWSRWINSTEYYGREGVTWPLRASRFGPSALPSKSVFSVRGYAAFAPKNSLLPMMGVFNSQIFDYLFKVALGRFGHPEFVVGVLQWLPWPEPELSSVSLSLGKLVRRSWSLKRSLDTLNEISHAFLLPPGLNEKVTGLDRDAIERELEAIQQQIDEVAFVLYGIGAEDRATIEASSKRAASSDTSEEQETGDDGDEAPDDESLVAAEADTLNSWLIGVALGRFDPRLATSEREIPPEPEPFDPLPSRSPGMWPEGEEPAQRTDILVDDEGHADDLVARVSAVAERVHVDVPASLRAWIAKDFFPLHIKMYSKSRRKAPIYWQLATPSASYSVWLYIHAFSKDTLFRVQNDYAALKLAHEERRLEALTRELRDKATAAQRKELAARDAFVEELRTFLEEVKRVAPLWNPNLDDGVIINFAPLWRLVPQNKSWQKELKSIWDALCNGKYDWAYLAMHLWPERVVPKCVGDRSLAIAHGLEDVFWVEGADGKWTGRETPTRSVDELVRERTSPAVKSALKTLLEAPVPTGNGGRRRSGRHRSAAVTEGEDA